MKELKKHPPPLLAFSGYSGSGKTTLIEKLIAFLISYGLRVAAVKHDAHDFEIDKEGKDSWRFTQAGAEAVLLSSQKKSALLQTYRADELTLDLRQAAVKYFLQYDIVLVEGYRLQEIPRVLVTNALNIPESLNKDLLVAVVYNDFGQKFSEAEKAKNKVRLQSLQKPIFTFPLTLPPNTLPISQVSTDVSDFKQDDFYGFVWRFFTNFVNQNKEE